MARFTCPKVAAHDEFYARHHESFAHIINAYGVDEGEIDNSMDGHGWDPVRCATCNAIARDANPGAGFDDEV